MNDGGARGSHWRRARPADWKSAIRQVGNLRYVSSAVRKLAYLYSIPLAFSFRNVQFCSVLGGGRNSRKERENPELGMPLTLSLSLRERG